MRVWPREAPSKGVAPCKSPEDAGSSNWKDPGSSRSLAHSVDRVKALPMFFKRNGESW
jgi:hypothetical protein